MHFKYSYLTPEFHLLVSAVRRGDKEIFQFRFSKSKEMLFCVHVIYFDGDTLWCCMVLWVRGTQGHNHVNIYHNLVFTQE